MNLNAMMIASLISALVSWSNKASASFYPNEDDCRQNKSLYYQYLKMKMYPDARTFWLKAYESCGGTTNLNATFFHNGVLIYKGLAKVTFVNDSIHQREVLDSAKWVYDQYLLVDSSATVKLDYACFLVGDKDTSFRKITTLFESVDDLKNLVRPNQMKLYFQHLLLNVYNHTAAAERDSITSEIIKAYFKLQKYANIAIDKAVEMEDLDTRGRTIESYERIKTLLKTYLEQLTIDCTEFERQMEVQFQKLSTDSSERYDQLVDNIDLMDSFKCTASSIYVKYVYASLAIKPSAMGFTKLGKLEREAGNATKAILNFQKALELMVEDSLKSATYYELAMVYYEVKSYKKAFMAAKQVQGKNYGKAMILCGNAIAKTANSCGESTFERDANYWLANDYYVKASKYEKGANNRQFLDYSPNKEACFKENLKEGDSYLLPHWKEKTIVRF